MSLQRLIFAVGLLLVTQTPRIRSLHHRIIYLNTDIETKNKILFAYDIVRKAFEQFGDTGALALAFNGGKDCLVVYQLVKAYCERTNKHMPAIVYFKGEDEFPEMIEFLHETLDRHNLPLKIFYEGVKKGLADLQKDGIQAVFMGQRITDPYAPPSHFAKTDEGWPDIIRINPILSLDYASVWKFLKGTKTRYCALYDDGYTSLGPKSKTSRNSLLYSQGKHRSADELELTESERQGRCS